MSADNIADRAAGYGMPGVIVDGFDFFAVYEVAGEAIRRAREGGGPTLIEVKLTRYYGHFEGDQQTYRPKDEIGNARESLDCLKRFREPGHRDRPAHRRPTGPGRRAEVAQLIEESVAEAKAAAEPGAADLLTDVYVKY